MASPNALTQLSSKESDSDVRHYRATLRFLLNLSRYFPDRLLLKGGSNG